MPIRSTHSKTSERAKTARGSASGMRESVLQMLKDDHKKVKKAFRDFEKLDPHEEPERCAELVTRTCTELEIHAQLEEEIFYPAVRQALKEHDLLEEAEVEHTSAKMLIANLRGMSPEDEKYGATFTVLGEYVKHHIQEEEKEMFAQIERSKIDWSGLHEAMQSRHEELMAEHGMSETMEGDSEVKESASPASRSRSGRTR
jgi:hypothetical protein